MSIDEKLVISYCRKSTKTKDKSVEESVAYQKEAIRKYVEQNGLILLKEYNDVGFSGKDDNRPGLQEMLTFLKTTQLIIDEVVIYSIDRLGRDLYYNIQIITEIRKYVSRVYFVSDNLPTDLELFRPFFLMLTCPLQKFNPRLNHPIFIG